MTQPSVVGVYDSLDSAEAAVSGCRRQQVSYQQIPILAKDAPGRRRSASRCGLRRVQGERARTGAWVGGIFGLLVGGVLWVPGVALVVAGSLSAVLLGVQAPW